MAKKLLNIYKNYTMIKNRWLKSGKNLYVTNKIKKCSLNLKIKAKGRLPQNMKKRYAFKNQINQEQKSWTAKVFFVLETNSLHIFDDTTDK